MNQLSTNRLAQLPHDAPCVRKVRRAVAVAVFNAWCFAVAAVASALLLAASTVEGHFTIAAAGITVALGVIAYYEFRGRRMLNELDPKGCRLLGWNQLALLAALTIYCAWSIVWGFLYPSNLAAGLEEHPELLARYSEAEQRDLKEAIGIIDDLWPGIIASVYGGVIIATLIYQGGNAWYYFTRRKPVEECRTMVESTPPQIAH